MNITLYTYVHDIPNLSGSKEEHLERRPNKKTINIKPLTSVGNHSYCNENDKTSGRCGYQNVQLQIHTSLGGTVTIRDTLHKVNNVHHIPLAGWSTDSGTVQIPLSSTSCREKDVRLS